MTHLFIKNDVRIEVYHKGKVIDIIEMALHTHLAHNDVLSVCQPVCDEITKG